MYTDVTWVTRPDKSCKGGTPIFLKHVQALTESLIVVDWRSRQLERMCRSSLVERCGHPRMCRGLHVDTANAGTMTMTMTMTHSEKSHIRRMKAWPYRQECRGHDSTKKESVLLMKLAHWQGVQAQTVKDRVQCIKSRNELKVQGNNKDTRSHRLLLC